MYKYMEKKISLKKKIIITLAASIIVIAVLFAAFAFGAWKINPAKWDGFGRTMFALIGLMVIIMPVGFVVIEHED